MATSYSNSPIFAVPDGSTMFCWPRAVTTSAGDSPFDWSRRWSRSTMIWRCLPPYGYGIEAPGTVTSWVLRKLRPASLSSDSESPDRASCRMRSEEHTSELQSRLHLVCRLLLEKKKAELIGEMCITLPAVRFP